MSTCFTWGDKKQLLVSVGGSINGACFSWWVKKIHLKNKYLFGLGGKKYLLALPGGSIFIFTYNLCTVGHSYGVIGHLPFNNDISAK